jgi:hypothetical protein
MKIGVFWVFTPFGSLATRRNNPEDTILYTNNALKNINSVAFSPQVNYTAQRLPLVGQVSVNVRG